MLLTYIADALTGLLALGIILIGARFLLAPHAAAMGFGVPAGTARAYLAVKGVRDIASGLFAVILLTAGTPRALAWFLLAAALIPVGDGVIMLRFGGSVALAFGVHFATAAVMLIAAALLII